MKGYQGQGTILLGQYCWECGPLPTPGSIRPSEPRLLMFPNQAKPWCRSVGALKCFYITGAQLIVEKNH